MNLNILFALEVYFGSDTGSHDTLIDSSAFIKKYEENSGEVIASIEQIAYRKKLITLKQYKDLLNKIPESNYKFKLVNNLKYGKSLINILTK